MILRFTRLLTSDLSTVVVLFFRRVVANA